MKFTLQEDDDGRSVLELDEEAIDYLVDGLIVLRGEEAGVELSTPVVVDDFEAMTEFVLLRADDTSA